jgi:hypothetical protein
MATDIASFASSIVPSGESITNFFLFVGIGIMVAGMIATCVYLYIQKKKYNKTVFIFKKISGKPEWVETWKGMFERISLAGDFWLKCRNGKILSRPIYEAKKGFYFYNEGKDGELRNFMLEDIDDTLRKANVIVVKEDMRLTRLSMEELLKKRLQKKSWWEENKSFVANLVLIIIVIIALVYVLSQIKDLILAIGKLVDVLSTSLASHTQAVNPATGVRL